MPPTYDFSCNACETLWDATVRYEERDHQTCPVCSSLDVKRFFPTPNVVGKASFLDGHKRKGWSEIREAAKLNKEKAVARGETKKALNNEIRKLGVKVE